MAGRVVPVIWLTPRFPNGIAGPMTWRADSCQHLIMDSGRCPEVINEVAVSLPDAERYGVRAGQVLQRLSPISEPQAITVTGIYRPRDPAEGYWFGNPPVGRSGFNTADEPQSNPLITVSDFGDTLGVQDTLDLRLDRAAIGIDDLAELRVATSQLAKAAVADKIRLNTQIPQSLDHIAAERARAVTTLGLTLAQLGALVAVVVALLASVAVTAQRGELGLARLRGEPARSLRRQVLGRWAAAMAIGWLLGWIPGVALLAFTARALPLDHGLPIAPALLVVPLVALVVMTAGVLPAAQAVLGQPVIELLRSSPSASREAGRRQLLVDAVVLVLALSGLLVAVQSGTDSVLAVLVPSLLAVAVGVLLARVMIGAAGLARHRWTGRGRRAGGLLTGDPAAPAARSAPDDRDDLPGCRLRGVRRPGPGDRRRGAAARGRAARGGGRRAAGRRRSSCGSANPGPARPAARRGGRDDDRGRGHPAVRRHRHPGDVRRACRVRRASPTAPGSPPTSRAGLPSWRRPSSRSTSPPMP